MSFVQIIEFTTTRPDEVEALVDEWMQKTTGRRTASRGTFTADRDRPNVFVQIVEFASYEDAMANSRLRDGDPLGADRGVVRGADVVPQPGRAKGRGRCEAAPTEGTGCDRRDASS